MKALLLNADVGEGLESDQQLYPFLDQANIACGGHAGDTQTMQQAVQACLQYGVTIGAHPSYPDRSNFGRKSLSISKNLLIDNLQKQIADLDNVCVESQAELAYVKPHGALYNDMMVDADKFESVLEATKNYSRSLAMMIGAGSENDQRYFQIAEEYGVKLLHEVFADRQYAQNGSLVPRSKQGSVFSSTDKILTQVTELKNGFVSSIEGAHIPMLGESLCIHGDNLASVDAVAAVANKLVLLE